MPLEVDIRSVSSGDPVDATRKVRELLASGRVHPYSWVDAQGRWHVRVVLDPPEDRPIER